MDPPTVTKEDNVTAIKDLVEEAAKKKSVKEPTGVGVEAVRLLRDTGRPMTLPEMLIGLKARGVTVGGKDPRWTLSASLINARGGGWKRVAQGVYAAEGVDVPEGYKHPSPPLAKKKAEKSKPVLGLKLTLPKLKRKKKLKLYCPSREACARKCPRHKKVPLASAPLSSMPPPPAVEAMVDNKRFLDEHKTLRRETLDMLLKETSSDLAELASAVRTANMDAIARSAGNAIKRLTAVAAVAIA